MATTKFYLSLRGNAKDGKGSIVLILYHNYSTAEFSTGIRIYPHQWDKQKQRIKGVPGEEILNAQLVKRKEKIDRSIAILSVEEDDFMSMTATDIKHFISERNPRLNKRHLVSELFYDYTSTSNLKPSTLSLYHFALEKILQYGGSTIKIEDIDYKWIRGFDSFLAKGMCVNGRSAYLRILRTICNHAINCGIDYKYPFKRFQIKMEETRKRSVTVEKLRELYYYPVNELQSHYRDYFFLIFFLIGINIKDLLLAKNDQVVKGRLEYIREKTGKKYSVKIEPEAQAIIDRLHGEGNHLLSAMDNCKNYKVFGNLINRSLRSIGSKTVVRDSVQMTLFEEETGRTEFLPVIPGISTYYARHSWATIAYDIGIPFDIISQALGHSFGNKTTLIYIKQDRTKVDEANRRVIDHFFSI